MVKAVGYIRVSTEEQASSGISLDAQKAKLEAYAALYDIELVGIEVDAGVSAKTLNRPGLQSALARLESGEATALIVVKLDRLTRRVADLDTLIERYFGSRFTLMSVSEQIDTSSAAGRLVLNVLTSVAQWERETTSERTKTALAHKKTQGQHVGSAGFGYKMVEKKLTQVHSEHETIAVIQELRSAGHTLQEIADHLNANGYQTQRGGKWYPTTIANVLKRGVTADESTRAS
jgi:DNA invertase Pin-like site-specific DNA recombinase